MSKNDTPVSSEVDPLLRGADVDAQAKYYSSSSAASSFWEDEVYAVDDDTTAASEAFQALNPHQRHEMRKADALSMRLLAIEDDDEEEQDRVLRQSLNILDDPSAGLRTSMSTTQLASSRRLSSSMLQGPTPSKRKICTSITLSIAGVLTILALFYVGREFVGPPNLPVGPYKLVERQEGEDFFQYYQFYQGADSVGSNGYNMYVGFKEADELGIVNVTFLPDEMVTPNTTTSRLHHRSDNKQKPFVFMGSAATQQGPRDSIRLEGIRRFDRGLFIIDVRHIPAGCGVWPAFWLTDEPNWPVNGEIDILEGVNYQSNAKTALHSTQGCVMDDIPLGVMTGGWDTAIGIPDKDTGVPDMTMRYAQNCFVYDPHQWLNQGCVANDLKGGSLGKPLNDKGGGVFVLEWDPTNRYIKSWAFTPHNKIPENLRDTIETANLPPGEQVLPDPSLWPLPYAYFAVGEGTNCPASHFRHMRIVFNTAFCGSVAGNRFHLDCTEEAKNFSTCHEWIKSNPAQMEEAYWKIRGVYVFEREFQRRWIN